MSHCHEHQDGRPDHIGTEVNAHVVAASAPTAATAPGAWQVNLASKHTVSWADPPGIHTHRAADTNCLPANLYQANLLGKKLELLLMWKHSALKLLVYSSPSGMMPLIKNAVHPRANAGPAGRPACAYPNHADGMLMALPVRRWWRTCVTDVTDKVCA